MTKTVPRQLSVTLSPEERALLEEAAGIDPDRPLDVATFVRLRALSAAKREIEQWKGRKGGKS